MARSPMMATVLGSKARSMAAKSGFKGGYLDATLEVPRRPGLTALLGQPRIACLDEGRSGSVPEPQALEYLRDVDHMARTLLRAPPPRHGR